MRQVHRSRAPQPAQPRHRSRSSSSSSSSSSSPEASPRPVYTFHVVGTFQRRSRRRKRIVRPAASCARPSVRYEEYARICCKANLGFSLTVNDDGHVVLAPTDPEDLCQYWVRVEKEDEEGFPCFSLINRITGEALKKSNDEPVGLMKENNNPYIVDMSMLWTESEDWGNGYRALRRVGNNLLNLEALNGDPQHESVRDGIKIDLRPGCKNDPNQSWKIERVLCSRD